MMSIQVGDLVFYYPVTEYDPEESRIVGVVIGRYYGKQKHYEGWFWILLARDGKERGELGLVREDLLEALGASGIPARDMLTAFEDRIQDQREKWLMK